MPENGTPTQYIDHIAQWLVTHGPGFIIKLLFAALILVVSRILIRVAVEIVKVALDKYPDMNNLLKAFILNVIPKVLWVFVWVVVLAQLGVQVGPLIAGVSVTGFIIGFAFQDTLSNFAAGLMLLANSPFKVGNFVEVNGHAGVVRELNIIATVLTTPDNKRLTIPNKLVWGSTITNFTAMETRRVDMTVGISYGSDINKAREIIKQVLAEDERVLKDPAPVVEVMSLADSSVNFVVRPWSKTTDYWGLYFSTMQKVKERFAESGVEIPFPQRVVHMVNKNG